MQQTLSSLEVRSPGTLVPGYRFILYYSLLLDALQILPPSLVAWLAKLGLAPSREWLLVLAKGVNKVAMVILVPWGLFWVAGVSHALFGVRGTGEGEGSAPKDEPSKLALSSMPFGALPIVLNWYVAFLFQAPAPSLTPRRSLAGGVVLARIKPSSFPPRSPTSAPSTLC